MSGTIRFMFFHIGPPLIQTGEGIIGIQVSVRFLGGGDDVNPSICSSLKHGVMGVADGIGHGFKRFIDVTVVIIDSFVFFTLMTCHLFKISNAGRVDLCLINAGCHRGGSYFLLLGGPESIINLDAGEGDKSHIACWLREHVQPEQQ